MQTDPNTGGQKAVKPERYELIPVWPMAELARVYNYGCKKYKDHNWQRGYPWSWSIGALLRHIARFLAGETIDPESKLHHLAHAVFHLLTLMEFGRRGLGTDDRGFNERNPLVFEREG